MTWGTPRFCDLGEFTKPCTRSSNPRAGLHLSGSGGCVGVGGALALARIARAGLRDALQRRAAGGPGLDPGVDLGLDPGAGIRPDHAADREAVPLDPALEHRPTFDDPAVAQVFEI